MTPSSRNHFGWFSDEPMAPSSSDRRSATAGGAEEAGRVETDRVAAAACEEGVRSRRVARAARAEARDIGGVECAGVVEGAWRAERESVCRRGERSCEVRKRRERKRKRKRGVERSSAFRSERFVRPWPFLRA